MSRNDVVVRSSKVFDIIRNRIINGEYESGTQLVEQKLAQELGVSRTPIREALKQLELESLIISYPNRGMFVKGISKRDFEDIFVMRTELEKVALDLAIERITDEEIQELEEIYALMEYYTGQEKMERLMELDLQFHTAIYEATDSYYLIQTLKDFQSFVKTTRVFSFRRPNRMPVSLQEHREILDAIISRDKGRAIKMMAEHLHNVYDNVYKVILAEDEEK